MLRNTLLQPLPILLASARLPPRPMLRSLKRLLHLQLRRHRLKSCPFHPDQLIIGCQVIGHGARASGFGFPAHGCGLPATARYGLAVIGRSAAMATFGSAEAGTESRVLFQHAVLHLPTLGIAA